MQGRLRHVPIPSNVWATPGHYSVIGLLPDDHTYAKGSLFIVKPGTKAVVFDVDGAQRVNMLAAQCGPRCRAPPLPHSWERSPVTSAWVSLQVLCCVV